MLPEGMAIDGEPKKTICLEVDEETNWEFKLEVKPDFKVPVLSFWTVLITCQLQVGNLPYVFPISAGFELDRPPMKRKK